MDLLPCIHCGEIVGIKERVVDHGMKVCCQMVCTRCGARGPEAYTNKPASRKLVLLRGGKAWNLRHRSE